MSPIYSINTPKLAKALGVLLIVLAILVALIGWWAILYEIGFSTSYILSDYPLVERMMYLFIRLGLILAPPFMIIIGLVALRIGPWFLKEIVLEPDRIVLRQKNGKEITLHEIKEMKTIRVGVNIKVRTEAGKLTTWTVGKSMLGKKKFTMFKDDLESLYGEVK